MQQRTRARLSLLLEVETSNAGVKALRDIATSARRPSSNRRNIIKQRRCRSACMGELAFYSLDQAKHCFVLFSLPGINTARPNDLPSAARPRMNELIAQGLASCSVYRSPSRLGPKTEIVSRMLSDLLWLRTSLTRKSREEARLWPCRLHNWRETACLALPVWRN